MWWPAWAQGRPTDRGQAKGERWWRTTSITPADPPGAGPGPARHHAYCARFVVPVIAGVELRRLSRAHFVQVLAPGPHRLGGGPSETVLFSHGGRGAGRGPVA
jgi:hypothetical protein